MTIGAEGQPGSPTFSWIKAEKKRGGGQASLVLGISIVWLTHWTTVTLNLGDRFPLFKATENHCDLLAKKWIYLWLQGCSGSALSNTLTTLRSTCMWLLSNWDMNNERKNFLGFPREGLLERIIAKDPGEDRWYVTMQWENITQENRNSSLFFKPI